MSFVAKLSLTDLALAKALSEHIVERLAATGRFRLHGFGVFKVVRKKARRVRNPQTKEIIEIPAMNTILFHADLKLRRAAATLKPYQKKGKS